MKSKPILIVPGDPNSIFFEIFFKSIKKNTYKSPLILISSLDVLKSEMKIANIKKTIRLINHENLKNIKIDNKTINLINIDSDLNFNFKKYPNHLYIYI